LNLSVEASSNLRPERELPLKSYLRALRYSPIRSRIVIARKLFPYLFQRVARSTAEICEFDSLENYETTYRSLARLLGHNEKVPPPGEMDFLRAIHNRGAHPGTISLPEFLFLMRSQVFLLQNGRSRSVPWPVFQLQLSQVLFGVSIQIGEEH